MKGLSPRREKKKPSQSRAGEWCKGSGKHVNVVRFHKKRRAEGTEERVVTLEADAKGRSRPVRCPVCGRRLTAKIVACCEHPSGPDPAGCGHLEVPRHKRRR